MTGKRFKLAVLPRWTSVAAFLLAMTPGIVFATHFELSRLATQIELISDQLAEDLRYTRHYGSVRQRAATLRREASQLADSLQRNRSNSRIRSRFKDVRRSYERLEQAFFTADRRDHIPSLYQEINLLSNMFASLSEEFYYAGLGGQSYGPSYDVPYGGLTIIGSRNSGFRNPSFRNPGFRNSNSRNRDSRNRGARNYDPRNDARNTGSRNSGSRNAAPRQNNNRGVNTRSSGRIEPNRERAIPPVFRGNNPRVTGNRQGSTARSDGRAATNRITRGQSAPAGGHSSPVLERQARQDGARRNLERQARQNRQSAPRRSPRGTNVQRGRNSAGQSQSRRRNN